MIQITGASDRRTREAILHASAGRVGKRMDTLLVPLELLSAVPHSAFPDKIQYIRWSKRQVSSQIFLRFFENLSKVNLHGVLELVKVLIRSITSSCEARLLAVEISKL